MITLLWWGHVVNHCYFVMSKRTTILYHSLTQIHLCVLHCDYFIMDFVVRFLFRIWDMIIFSWLIANTFNSCRLFRYIHSFVDHVVRLILTISLWIKGQLENINFLRLFFIYWKIERYILSETFPEKSNKTKWMQMVFCFDSSMLISNCSIPS